MPNHWRRETGADGVCRLTFDKAGASANTLSKDVLAELDEQLRAIADERPRGLIIRSGKPTGFVLGADVKEFEHITDAAEGARLAMEGQIVLARIEALELPTVAVIDGFALGGGLELALACHIRIAAEGARFGLPEVKLGIIPGYGGTVRLPRLVGRGRALELILTGEMIDAAEAYRIGLVNRVVPRAEVRSAAEELVRRILANGPVAVGLALEAVDHGYDTAVEDALSFEAHLFGLLAATADMREGMQAFLEKRPPQFQGR